MMILMFIASFILTFGLNNLEDSNFLEIRLLKVKGVIQIILGAIMAVVGLFIVFERIRLNI